MNIDSFINDVLNEFTSSITERVFLMIQNDHELMRQYLDIIDKNSRLEINTKLPKAIRETFNLINTSEEKQSKSKLIQTYTRLEKS